MAMKPAGRASFSSIFRTIGRTDHEGPKKNGGRRIVFVSGDHPEPTEFVMSVIESVGFLPIYLGVLATGGHLQQAGGPLAGRDLVDFGSL
jgi:predicted dinucleotide-binding enzyme